jgi:uncharacterized membrane protein
MGNEAMIKIRGMTLVSVLWVLVLAGLSWWAAHTLPPGAQLPMHWNAAGEVDRYGDKSTALMMAPLMAAVVSLVFVGIAGAEPRQDNLARSRSLFRVLWIGVLGLSGIIELSVLAKAFHWPIDALPLMIGAMGLFFVAMGNLLSKSRPMYFVGIRTPWTLADPEIWVATHRIGGKTTMIAGLIWLACALGGRVNAFTMPSLVLVMIVATLIPVVYSYISWRRLPRDERVS